MQLFVVNQEDYVGRDLLTLFPSPAETVPIIELLPDCYEESSVEKDSDGSDTSEFEAGSNAESDNESEYFQDENNSSSGEDSDEETNPNNIGDPEIDTVTVHRSTPAPTQDKKEVRKKKDKQQKEHEKNGESNNKEKSSKKKPFNLQLAMEELEKQKRKLKKYKKKLARKNKEVSESSDSCVSSDSDSEKSSKSDTKSKKKLATDNSQPFPDLCDIGVMTIDRKFEKKRKLSDQKACCCFCNKLIQKLPRHLEQVHGDEPEVIDFLSQAKKSVVRVLMISALRKRGNNMHNKRVIETGVGFVIPKYRSKYVRFCDMMLICPQCKGLYAEKYLTKHMKTCSSTSDDIPNKCSSREFRRIAKEETCFIASDSILAKVRPVIEMIRDKEILSIVKSDPVILSYGAKHLFKLGTGASLRKNKENVRSRMRDCARAVLAARIISGKEDFNMSDFFSLDYYDVAFEVVYRVGGFDASTFQYSKTSSFGLKFKQHLNITKVIVRKNAVIAGNKTKKEDVDSAYELLNDEWPEMVSFHCRRQLNTATFNQPNLLPPTTQITKVYLYLKENRLTLVHKLKENYTAGNFRALSSNLFVRLVYFNRRRVGEVESMRLEWYHAKLAPGEEGSSSPLEEVLSEMEKSLMNYFTRIELRGKKGRKVPMLFTPDMVSDMDLLIACRSECTVHAENPFLFPLTRGDESHVSGYPLMRRAAEVSGVANAYLFTGTNLRKVFATSLQLLALQKNTLREFAKFMGHDIDIHKEYYRLQSDVFQCTKIGKVLLESAESQLNKNQNKSIEGMEFTSEELMSIAAAERQMDPEIDADNAEQRAFEEDADADLDRAAAAASM